jgi:hypothetical protein
MMALFAALVIVAFAAVQLLFVWAVFVFVFAVVARIENWWRSVPMSEQFRPRRR